MDRTTLALQSSEGLDALAPDQSETRERVGGTDVTNQQIDPAVKQEASVRESVPVLDNGHPSNTVQSYTESRLAKLSEPQTRSVYGVVSDPVMSEPRVTPAEKILCVYETQEHQTPDKHTSETPRYVYLKGVVEPRTVAPEINTAPSASLNSEPRVEEPVTIVEEDSEPAHAQRRRLGVACSPQRILPQDSDSSHEGACLVSGFDTPLSELQELRGSPEKTLEDTNNCIAVTEEKCIPEAELNAISRPADSSSQSSVLIRANIAEAQERNQTDRICTSALSRQSSDTQISILKVDSVFADTKQNDQPDYIEKQIPGVETGSSDASETNGSSLLLDVPLKETLGAELNGSLSTTMVLKNKSSTPSRAFISEQKSMLPSGLQDLLRSPRTPVYSVAALRNRGKSFNSKWSHSGSVHLVLICK